jgi:hypothetical protein
MPVTVKKTKKGCYSVKTPHGTKAKCTSKHKAKAQERLLNAIEHNPSYREKLKSRVMAAD